MTTTTTHRIESIEVRRMDDDCPDLSWLDQTDEQMGAGFEESARERKSTYGDSWAMVGVQAVAEVVIGRVVQRIHSGGLWGIESDSDESYFAEVGSEELDQLAEILRALGFTGAEMAEAWPDGHTFPHPKVSHGRCDVCGHYGDDCTGASE